MNKFKCHIVFICFILLLFPRTVKAEGDDSIKNIEIIDDNINIDNHQFPSVAYLYITLRNNGDKKISNVTFEIRYYEEGGYLIQKAVLKNALNEAIPKAEVRKYKIRLKGDIVNTDNEQYPYSQHNEVDEYDIKIINARLASR